MNCRWPETRHSRSSAPLAEALLADVAARFTRVGSSPEPQAIADIVLDFLDRTAEARNLARF
jgi:hypothetical protein